MSTTQAGCSPLTVQFFSNVTGPVNSYFWDFGNGNTSTLTNPGVIYVNPGTYTVSLTVSDGFNTDTEAKTAYITVFADPVVNFSATPTGGCAPLTVNFADLSTPGDAPINAWSWDFGDGNLSSQQNPTHTYASAGSYDLTLVATDANGCSSTLSLPDHVVASDPPSLSFTATATNPCQLPYAYSFNPVISPAGSYNYSWDFGDGSFSGQVNPTHIYATPGTYPVMLILSDPNGCADTLSQTLAVQLQTPVANFSLADTLVCVGQTLNFFNLSVGAQNYVWDLGDGTTFTGPNPTHAYTTPGTYTVSLVAISGASCTDTLVRTAYVEVQPSPNASFSSSDPTDCQAPLIVNFTDASSADVVNWAWDFGDGNTATAPSPSHVYTNLGLYDVSLVVTNGFGCSDSLLQPNYVQIIAPIADFVPDTVAGCLPLNVDFLDLSTTLFDSINAYVWDFGDGGTSFLPNPTHTYTNAGQYDVSLIVQTVGGCRDTAVFSFIQAGQKPVVNFTGNPQAVCAEDIVSFQDLSSIGNEFIWFFGDGTMGMGPNPTHSYVDTGFFDVTLIVGHFGCYDTLIRTDYIEVLSPLADFAFTPNNGCTVPLTVNFVDQSVEPQRWLWDFGDGSTDSVQNPVHTYTGLGSYTITLTVINDSTGCTDQFSQTLDIFPPTANFTASANNGCVGLPVNFTNNSTFANTYFWDFGDGNTSTAANPTHTYSTPGLFDVTLIVNNNNGCADTLIMPALMDIVGPQAQFQANITTGCAPLAVSFTDLSTTFPAGTFITGWSWDFGDGGTSFSQNPSYTYNQIGSYDVSLVVADNQGCVDTLTLANYLNPTFPTADFSTADTISCPGALTAFTNLSTGVGNSYLWDFGDGTTSSAVNPVHAYPPNGTYTVSLTVTDINGCVSNTIKQNLVSIGLPAANFFANPTQQACPPLTVNFTDLSSPTVTNWLWDFGDGSTSTLANPSKIYNIPGDFDVTLVVTTDQGCSDTLTMPDLVNLSGPSGSFSMGPITGCSPLDVTFTASTDSAISWTWDFGDGALGFGQTTTHTYTQDTVAFPLLLIQDTAGCVVAIPGPDSVVSLGGPNPAFLTSQDTLCIGDPVQFSNASTSAIPIVSYEWKFGDGTNAAATDPLHVYSTPGLYVPTLIATDANGCVDSISAAAPVLVSTPPQAIFTPSATDGCLPLQVLFANTSVASTNLSYIWDFGDGGISTQQFPFHSFNTAGSYSVKLLITDAAGCQDSAFSTITVRDLPTVDFTAAPTVGCAPRDVQFVSLAGGTSAISNWFWDFGDGNTSTQTNPIHTYTNDGSYDVSLTVVDVHGCSASMTQTDLVDLLRPTANFTSNASPDCPTQTVDFSPNVVSSFPIANWTWAFGDGDSATIQNPTHLYDSVGIYNVTLIIEDVFGCADTLIDPQHVTVYQAPVAAFQALDSICMPGNLSVLNQSLSGASPIVSYQYDFGNGNTANTANATTLYPGPGTYPVSLIVIDAFGCTDTVQESVEVFPTVTANFNVLNGIGCSSTPVSFVDQSNGVNPPIAWNWDFGDGNNSNQQFPTHSYNNNGIFTVTLTVTDINGCQDTISQPSAVNLNGPQANFSLSTLNSCPGAQVDFFDASTADTTITNWAWDFGDGNTATGANPNHFYSAAGSYNVTLTITDAVGCEDTEVQSAAITILPAPNAQIYLSDTVGCLPFVVSFADSSTSALNITAWDWDFGNGNTSIFPTSTQAYNTAGVYQINLTVTDAQACVDSATYTLVVNDGPSVEFAASDTSGCASKTVSFVDLSTGSTSIATWAWDFGDGNTSTQQSPIHTYLNNGNYDVQLVVSDNNGCTDSLTKFQHINLTQPLADFGINTAAACPGFSFSFNDLSVADTSIVSWVWTFGDGTGGSGPNPTHVYADTGFYDVSLTITDLFGCTATIIRTDTIEVLPLPEANYILPDSAGCSPFVAQFQNASTSANGIITTWTYDFGTGDSSSFPNNNYTFNNPGIYPVSLHVVDALGCEASFLDTVEVFGPPQANFLASSQILCLSDTVDFQDISLGSSNIINWFWDFGDGNTSNQQNPQHSYNAVGTYSVSLVAFDENGCIDTLLRPDYITVTQPTADFSLDQNADCPGLTVSFGDLSIADTTLTGWLWDFGDGNTSNLTQPTHIYTTPGLFTVSLTVTNLLGCEETETKVDTITVFSPPTPDFTSSDTVGCLPLAVNFFDASSSIVGIQNWEWNFGDGATSFTVNPSHVFTQTGVFSVRLRLTDNNGCVDSTTQDIEIFELPTASFSVSDTVGCAPAVLLFTDLSAPNPVDWVWDFGDGNSSALQNPVHTYANTGSYTVKLTITDGNGCQDSLTRPNYINLQQPSGDFTVNYIQDCPPLDATFSAAATSPFGIASYTWDFGDGNSGLGIPIIHTYTDTGSYDVQLIITDSLGCADTITKPDLVQVFGVDLPASPNVHLVSVESDNEVRIVWEADNSDEFSAYILYRETPSGSGNWQEIYRSPTAADTLYYDLGFMIGGLDTRNDSYCYRVTTVNYCGSESVFNLADTHCTIEATATPLPDQIAVSWNPYVGWDVDAYEIYRVDNYDPNQAVYLDAVPGLRTNYIDTATNCFNSYTYRIAAVGFEPLQVSWSDSTSAVNQKSGITESNDLVRVSVEQDRYVQIDWKGFVVSDLEGIFLEKSSDQGQNWAAIQTFDASVTTFIDTAVQVKERPYWYRLFARDSCGFSSPYTNIGTSIHLEIDTLGADNQLRWTPYQLWAEGVDYYEIQLFDESSQQWVIRQIVPGDVTEFIDPDVFLDQGEYCYRIVAYERGGNVARSVSNTACIAVRPRLFAPNAFSPNLDGTNETFYLQGQYVETFQLRIYNRWGLQLFEAQNINDAWDGSYQGVPSQEGVYVWVAEGVFNTGQPFRLQGTVTLMR
ncbi:MAG: PKD domain-containing protein [Bacteroidota bacterium]